MTKRYIPDGVFFKVELSDAMKKRFAIQCKRAGLPMAEIVRMMVECFTIENEQESEHKNEIHDN